MYNFPLPVITLYLIGQTSIGQLIPAFIRKSACILVLPTISQVIHLIEVFSPSDMVNWK